jgi:hypothetical protein
MNRSPFRHSGEAHTLNDALPLSEESWSAAVSAGAEPAKGEVRIQRKSRLHGGPRFVQRAEQRQAGGKIEMRYWQVTIGLDAAAQPCDAFRVGTKFRADRLDVFRRAW